MYNCIDELKSERVSSLMGLNLEKKIQYNAYKSRPLLLLTDDWVFQEKPKSIYRKHEVMVTFDLPKLALDVPYPCRVDTGKQTTKIVLERYSGVPRRTEISNW